MTLQDLFFFFEQRKRILYKIFLFSFLAFLPLTFLRYPLFLAKGGFQDGSSSSPLEEQFKMLHSSLEQENSSKGKALIWMKSRPVLEKAVELSSLQLVPSMPRAKLAYLSHVNSSLFQAIVDLPLNIKGFHIKNKGLKTLKITPLSETKMRIEAMGEVKEVFLPAHVDLKALSFDIEGMIDPKLLHQTLCYRTLGVHKAARILKKRLVLVQSDQDRSALQITVKERSKRKAEAVLNAIFFAYQTHLEEKNRESLKKQLSHCLARQKELMGNTLEIMKGSFGKPHPSSLAEGISMEAIHQMEKELNQRALFGVSSMIEGIKTKLFSVGTSPRLIELGYSKSRPSSFPFPLVAILCALFVVFIYCLISLIRELYLNLPLTPKILHQREKPFLDAPSASKV